MVGVEEAHAASIRIVCHDAARIFLRGSRLVIVVASSNNGRRCVIDAKVFIGREMEKNKEESSALGLHNCAISTAKKVINRNIHRPLDRTEPARRVQTDIGAAVEVLYLLAGDPNS